MGIVLIVVVEPHVSLKLRASLGDRYVCFDNSAMGRGFTAFSKETYEGKGNLQCTGYIMVIMYMHELSNPILSLQPGILFLGF